jgi:uncharacterized protein YcbK (DUF882 family)
MISEHFSRSEFACKCGCGYDTVDVTLLEALEGLRTYFSSPVTITSGCRCKAHNEDVGGSPKSQHLYGRAADIKVKGISPNEVADYLDKKYPHSMGIGRYLNWTHIDSRNGMGRWDMR